MSWSCPCCTYSNPQDFLICEICLSQRPYGDATAAAAAEEPQQDEGRLIASPNEGATRQLQQQSLAMEAVDLAEGSAPAGANHPYRAGPGSSEPAGGCAYCSARLSPYRRWVCKECSQAGPAAAWFACQQCALQRNEGVMQSAHPSEGSSRKRLRRLTDKDQPCFAPGHSFLPVLQHGWVSLRHPPASVNAAEAAKQLEGFLADFQLSAAPPDVAWVAVHGKSTGGMRPVEHWDLQGAQVDWQEAIQLGKATAEEAQRIGRARGILVGKWLIMPSRADEQAIWAAVAKSVYVEGLCSSAKISAGPIKDKGTRVICVYTDDFTNKADVMRVHKGLSNTLQAALGARPWWVIRYKADIYTHLGIYAGRKQTNPKGIPACIYSQRLEPDLPEAQAGLGSAGPPPAAAPAAGDRGPQRPAAAAAAAAAAIARAAGKGLTAVETSPVSRPVGHAAAGPDAGEAVDSRAAATDTGSGAAGPAPALLREDLPGKVKAQPEMQAGLAAPEPLGCDAGSEARAAAASEQCCDSRDQGARQPDGAGQSVHSRQSPAGAALSGQQTLGIGPPEETGASLFEALFGGHSSATPAVDAAVAAAAAPQAPSLEPCRISQGSGVPPTHPSGPSLSSTTAGATAAAASPSTLGPLPGAADKLKGAAGEAFELVEHVEQGRCGAQAEGSLLGLGKACLPIEQGGGALAAAGPQLGAPPGTRLTLRQKMALRQKKLREEKEVL